MRAASLLLVAGGVFCLVVVWVVVATSYVSEGRNEIVEDRQQKDFWRQQLDEEEYSPRIGKTVYIEVSVDGIDFGRIDIGLFTYDVPITTENFRSLLTGERGNGHTIVGTVFHRIVSNFVIQGGKFYTKEGRISREEYDAFTFADEPRGLELKHSGRYIVQMANRGPDTNNSQFCFMLRESKHLNGKHVVFGRVTKGFDIVDAIEELASSPDGVPRAVVEITAGGEY